MEEVLNVLRQIPSRLVRFFEGGVCLTPSGMRVENAIGVELLELAERPLVNEPLMNEGS